MLICRNYCDRFYHDICFCIYYVVFDVYTILVFAILSDFSYNIPQAHKIFIINLHSDVHFCRMADLRFVSTNKLDVGKNTSSHIQRNSCIDSQSQVILQKEHNLLSAVYTDTIKQDDIVRRQYFYCHIRL